MFFSDVTAIDKLMDFYGEYLVVKYNNKIYDLGDLRDHLEDNGVAMSIDDHVVNRNGIFKDDQNIVSIHNIDSFSRDDLTKI